MREILPQPLPRSTKSARTSGISKRQSFRSPARLPSGKLLLIVRIFEIVSSRCARTGTVVSGCRTERIKRRCRFSSAWIESNSTLRASVCIHIKCASDHPRLRRIPSVQIALIIATTASLIFWIGRIRRSRREINIQQIRCDKRRKGRCDRCRAR